MTELAGAEQAPEELKVFLKRLVPEEMRERIHAFAYDLALGWVNELWSDTIVVTPVLGAKPVVTSLSPKGGSSPQIGTLCITKWSAQMPRFEMLAAFGYVIETKENVYRLTEKAVELLDRPPIAPTVFISYKRDKSSAFAVAVEARLKLIDSAIGVFVDKDIKAGEVWHAELEDQVKEASIFICLIAPGTLEAEYVQKEINWAMSDLSRKIIPVCHAGFDPNTLPDHLKARQYVAVQDEKARSYDIAINDIIHALGYSTV